MATTKKNVRKPSKKRDAKFAAAMAKDPNMGFNPDFKGRKRSLKG